MNRDIAAKKILILSLCVLGAVGILYFVTMPQSNENGELYKDIMELMQETERISQMDMRDILAGDITEETLDHVYIRLCEKCEYGYALQNCQDVEKNYWLVYQFYGEVGNGGIEQFLYHCFDVRNDTLQVFENLGLTASYQYLNEALLIYPSQFIEMYSDEALSKQLEQCDDKYYLQHEEEFQKWAIEYLKRHRDEFCE